MLNYTAKAQYLRSIGRVHIVKLTFGSKEAKAFWKEQQEAAGYYNEDEKGIVTTVVAKSLVPYMSKTRPINYNFGLNKNDEFFSGPEDTNGALDDFMEALVNAEKAKLIAQVQLGLIQLPGTRNNNATAQRSNSTPKEEVRDIPSGNTELDDLAKAMQEEGLDTEDGK